MKNHRIHLVPVIAIVLLAGCGGRSALDEWTTVTSSARGAGVDAGRRDASRASDGSASVDAPRPRDAGGALDAAADGEPSCTPAFVEAGTGMAGDVEIPIYHRALPSCCPTQRGPGPGTQPYGPGTAHGCTSDSQCTDGSDGRCFPFEGLVGPGGCSYDQCLTDADCSGAPCVCRTSASDDSANVCAPGGNCAVDSDCGPGGYCSPSQACFFYGPPTYYCHTASDTCVNGMDCPVADAGGGCSIPQNCVYDTQAQHWACSQQACCPP